jgi:hypothetical protein
MTSFSAKRRRKLVDFAQITSAVTQFGLNAAEQEAS